MGYHTSAGIKRQLTNGRTLTAATTLDGSAQFGTIFLNSATEFVTTLPEPYNGAELTFVVAAAPSGASYTIVTNGSANIIQGSVSTAADGTAAAIGADEDTITFVDGTAVVGDMVKLFSDGTNWYVTGQCAAAGGITLTQAS